MSASGKLPVMFQHNNFEFNQFHTIERKLPDIQCRGKTYRYMGILPQKKIKSVRLQIGIITRSKSRKREDRKLTSSLLRKLKTVYCRC